MKFINRTGERFERLVVVSCRPRMCTCRCDCGAVVDVVTGNLTSGNTQSCGCLHKERSTAASKTHGKTNTREFRIWQGIMARCYNQNVKAYPQYGGSGVNVCDRWHKFENFLSDMGTAPTPKHTVDRFPQMDGNYEPNNCRWATMKEQGNNRKSNVMIEHNGKIQNMRQWEEELGLCRGLIYARIKLGWTAEQALRGPLKKNGVTR